jgi:hypothetical protein
MDKNNYEIIEYPDGTKSWWLNNKQYSFSDWCKELKISKEEIFELVLIYG